MKKSFSVRTARLGSQYHKTIVLNHMAKGLVHSAARGKTMRVMAFSVDHIVPWGRSLDEYARMFALTEADLPRRILGCGDGPASFNYEWTQRGGRVVSCDPIYEYSKQQIQERFEAIYPKMLEKLQQNADDFVWNYIQSPQDLGERRRAAMQLFTQDLEAGKREGRYRAESLPWLGFSDDEFDLALSSHFLFLYSDHLTLEFHRESIHQMLRVAREVRIFPLLKVGGQPSEHVEVLAAELRQGEYSVECRRVDYEFQRGGNIMMRISRRAQ
jgi:SAM-dependent methyltransferase